MNRYSVGLIGCGARGKTHLDAFLALSDRFEVVGLCDLDARKASRLGSEYGIAATFADGREMMDDARPDVLCFATMPAVRLELVKLGIEYGVKGIAFEKPIALSVGEAREIHVLCQSAGVKTIVSHQMKYLTSMQNMYQMVKSGDIGEIQQIYATTVPWMHQLGTHYMDLICWLTDWSSPVWAIGHVHGRAKLSDSHPSPDYLFGQIQFENGIRAILDCGYLAPHNIQQDFSWVDNRITVYGTHGYVWGETDGRWGCLSMSRSTSIGEPFVEQGESWGAQSAHRLQEEYLAEFADWLDDDSSHICSVEKAVAGLEALHGIALSALDNTRVDFPVDDGRDVLSLMDRLLPQVPARS